MYYFLVYCDFTHNDYLIKLIGSVQNFGKQFKIIIFYKNDIDCDFLKKNDNILSLSRGGGYWLWKPYIINNVLSTINENDIVFYLDSKYYFTEKFEDLFMEHMKNNDLLIWKNKPNEAIFHMKNWCKMEVIMKYDLYDKVFNENVEDCWAGALIIKKTNNTMKYMKEWLDMSCIYENITDSPSVINNDSQFREHRHDQSLLSVIVHKYNIKMLYFEKKYLQNVRQPY